MQDKLWFFATARDYRTNNGITNTFFDDGAQGDDYNYIRDVLGRVTYQLSQKNKIAGYYDRISKYRGHDMQSLTDPETASNVWTSPNYSTGQIKLHVDADEPAPARRRMGVQHRASRHRHAGRYRPGSATRRRGLPVRRARSSGVTLGGAHGCADRAPAREWPERYSYNGAMSYVTGSHHIKGGFNGTYGKFFHETRANADLTQLYANVDTTAYVANGGRARVQRPVERHAPQYAGSVRRRPEPDIGLYGQDTWTLKRLTVSAGIRYEMLNARASHGLTARRPDASCRRAPSPEKTDLPNWKDWAPRFQMIYDVFGNSKTAVKYSINRYNAAQTTTDRRRASIRWRRRPRRGITWMDVNNDNIAQGQRTWNADGDRVHGLRLPDAGMRDQPRAAAEELRRCSGRRSRTAAIPRQYSIEQGLEVQHELLPRLSVTGSYYHGDFKNLTTTINRAVTPADYTPVRRLQPGRRVRRSRSTTRAQRLAGRASDNYTFVDPMTARTSSTATRRGVPRCVLAAERLIFGGMTWERERANATDGDADDEQLHGRPAAESELPALLRRASTWTDGCAVPYAKNFRLNGSYPLPLVGLIAERRLPEQRRRQPWRRPTPSTVVPRRYPDRHRRTSPRQPAGSGLPVALHGRCDRASDREPDSGELAGTLRPAQRRARRTSESARSQDSARPSSWTASRCRRTSKRST